MSESSVRFEIVMTAELLERTAQLILREYARVHLAFVVAPAVRRWAHQRRWQG